MIRTNPPSFPTQRRGLMRFAALLLLICTVFTAHAEVPNNPEPCVDWTCAKNGNVKKVTVTGPANLKVGEAGTWNATAETENGKQVCTASGAERDCPVTGVTWTMTADDKTVQTNTITRSFDKPGTYAVVGSAEPITNCCPGYGGNGQMYVKVGCDASTAKDTIEFDLAKLLPDDVQKLAEEGKQVPWIKDMSIKVFGTIKGEGYEKCCNASDAEPTKAWSVSGSGGIKATISIYLVGGKIRKQFQVPRWVTFGRYAVFDGVIEGGIYGGCTGEGKVTIKYKNECGTCLEYAGSVTGKGFIGLALGLKGEIIYDALVPDPAHPGQMTTEKYGCGAEGNAYAEISDEITFNGKKFDCYLAPKLRLCSDGVVIGWSLTAFCHNFDYGLKLGGSWKVLDGGCIPSK